jgi:hypothetical protein
MHMTFEELIGSIANEASPPSGISPALRALWLVRKGDWDGAHRVATDVDDANGARIHAHLHRVEGDLSNAGYWYRRAGVAPFDGSLDAEWEAIARALTSTAK